MEIYEGPYISTRPAHSGNEAKEQITWEGETVVRRARQTQQPCCHDLVVELARRSLEPIWGLSSNTTVHLTGIYVSLSRKCTSGENASPSTLFVAEQAEKKDETGETISACNTYI